MVSRNESTLNMTAVILAGGLGTRLRSVVSDRPKPMAKVGSKPFLEYLVERLQTQKISRIVLCVGYLKEKIIPYFADKYGSFITFAVESSPLGTAGALKNVGKSLPVRFLVLNGDTFTSINYADLFSFHIENHADMTLSLVEISGSGYGRVQLKDNLVTEFKEKKGTTGFVNAGVYVVEHAILDLIPDGVPFSIEKDLMPSLIVNGTKLAGYRTHNCDFVDIGEPDSYRFLLQNQEMLAH